MAISNVAFTQLLQGLVISMTGVKEGLCPVSILDGLEVPLQAAEGDYYLATASEPLRDLLEQSRVASPSLITRTQLVERLANSLTRLAPLAETEAAQDGLLIKSLLDSLSVLSSRRTILVVDDDQDMVDLTTFLLEKQINGISTLTASNGREALQRFREAAEEIALVVTDLTMPEMRGEDLVRKLRELRADLPIIVRSGDPEIPYFIEEDPLVKFMRKPVSNRDLTQAIQQHIPPVTDKSSFDSDE